jgi:hypothetical protein
MINYFAKISPLTSVALLCVAGTVCGAPQKSISMPDFTKGDGVPAGASHDWNLGATGCRGWMFIDKMVTTDARQIYITTVDKNSPADGVLAVGDVILGVGDEAFSYDPRTEMGKALSNAEREENRGALSLIRWRDGKTETVNLKLTTLGTYSETAPYTCQKSKRILEQGCKVLAAKMEDPGYKQNPIVRCLNGLALLASGDAEYLPLVKKEALWAADFSADGFQTWYYGYAITFLSEYLMATGDDTVTAGLKRLALEAANGQSVVGSWGHRFAQADGRLMGYGMMNAPGVPLTISLVMARAAGVKDPVLDRAIERSTRLLRFYVGKGAIPYGDHSPWIQTHEDNGKCGMAAVLFNLLGETESAEYFSRMSVASHGAERDGGHTGNFFNILWSLPSVAQSGPNATGAWMKEFGSWYFDLARRWDGTFVHLGPPEMKGDSYKNWDASGAYLLAYATPLKQIYLTGKRKSAVPQLDMPSVENLIKDGRGWSNKDRDSAYDTLSGTQLLERLKSWSPIVRERAAIALGRSKEDVTTELIRLLDDRDLYTRYGACQAIKMLRGRAEGAVKKLIATLDADDLWLRILAAEALASIGEPAKAAVPKLLTRLAGKDPKNDPRNMEQRYLSFALFNQRGGLLGKSLDGIDRDLLYQAVREGLKNEDGRARGSFGTVYNNLTYDEIKPLLPAIHQAIVEPAPSGIMFASGIRLSGVELLAKHGMKEGMELCFQIMEIDKWGKGDRINRCLNALEKYGAAAKPVLPQLRQLEKDLEVHKEARSLTPFIERTRALIKKIGNASDSV